MNRKQTVCLTGIRDDLKAYTDGELSPLRRLYVRTHLRHCNACRAELNEMERITMNLRKTSEMSASLSPSLRDRLLSQPPIPASAPQSPLWRRQPLLVFGTGGTLVAMSAAAFFSLYTPVAREKARQVRMPSSPSYSVGVAGMQYAQDYDGKFPVASAASAQSATRQFRSINGVRDSPRGGETASIERASEASANAIANRFEARGQIVPMAEVKPADAFGNGRSRQLAQANIRRPAEAEATTLTEERKVHREASLGVAVDHLEATSDRVEKMIKSVGGYIASNNLTTDSGGYKAADLTVKVPVERFDETMASVAKLGDVVSKHVEGEDITEKVSDATSDEQILVDETQKSEKRLHEETMSEKRTGQKEAELRELRLRLARTRARLGLLRHMSALSTINIELTEKGKKAPPKPGFLTDFQETNRAAALAFQSAVRVPLLMLIWVLAFSPLWVPLVLAYRWASLKGTARKVMGHETRSEEV